MGRVIDLTKELERFDLDDVDTLRDLLKSGVLVPDFKIHTTKMVSDPDNSNVVRMIGSSTEQDLQDDVMDIRALKDMTQLPIGLSVWLNHSYDLPDDLFGSIFEAPVIMQRSGVADLYLAVDVERDNPKAVQVKRYIDNGRRLGCSVGCMVTAYEVPEEETDGPDYYKKPIRIIGVRVLEFSVVGIPANQRSWVENAVRGIFTRTQDPRLIPAMKSMWPKVYKSWYESTTSDFQDAADKIPARPDNGKRLEWLPEKRSFAFTIGSTTHEYPEPGMKFHGVDTLKDMDELDLQDVALVYEPEDIKGACGSTSWPLADKGHGWDGPAAKSRLNKWAGDNKGKLKRVYFWTDGEDHFKLPFCDVIDGSIKAVPHAIHAVAGSLGGSRSGLDVPEADKAAIRRKVAAYYRKMGETPPWENDDKSVTDEVYMTEEGEILTMTVKKQFAINADGSQGVELTNAAGDHQPMTGSHSHPHKAFGHTDADDQDQHGHDHDHDNDSQHQHAHKAMSSPADANRDGDGDIDLPGGSQGGPGGGDDSGLPSSSRPAGQLAGEVPVVKELDASQTALMAAANGILKQLGLNELLPEHVLKGVEFKAVGDEAADHPAHLQTIHDMIASHAMVHHGMSTCSAYGSSASQANSDMDFQNARDQATIGQQDTSGRRMSGDVLVNLTKALEGFNVSQASADITVLKSAVEVLKSELESAKATLDNIQNMPLGNPTHLQRSVNAEEEGRVTHAELATITQSKSVVDPGNGDTIYDAIAKSTTVEERIMGSSRITVRTWPENFGGSVGKGFRPALTGDQMMFMTWPQISAYNDGKASEVPMIDDPIQKLPSVI